MKESRFGFEYSWRDLQHIRPLTVTVCRFGLVALVLSLSVFVGEYQQTEWEPVQRLQNSELVSAFAHMREDGK